MCWLELAAADMRVVRLLTTSKGNPDCDEYLYGYAGYHLQQAVEKTLKYILHDVYGMELSDRGFKTHNIADLTGMVDKHRPGVLPDSLRDYAKEITECEAIGRYGGNLGKDIAKLEKIMAIYEELRATLPVFDKDKRESADKSK